MTPCYIIDEKKLRNNLNLIANIAKEADVEFILAFKAFALWKTFPIFREYIRHTTASSLFEAKMAFEKFGSKAHTYSPAYEDYSFEDILKYSSHVTFNSLSQLNHFMAQTADSKYDVSYGLRVNPEYSEIETELYNPCAPGSRFGVLADNLPDTLPHIIQGFHLHCHCENNSDAFLRTLEHFETKFSKWFKQLSWINFGGGHLVTRKGYDIKLLIDTLKDFHKRYPWIKIIMEPGSAFAWQTGVLTAQIIDIVENHNIKTAIVNVSFTCHMPDCLEMPYMPEIKGAKIVDFNNPEKSNIYRIGGNSCLSGDYMGFWQFDHPLAIGDTIEFEDMIHYTTVKTTMFNGIKHPDIAIRRMDGSIEVLKQFSYDNYLDRMC